MTTDASSESSRSRKRSRSVPKSQPAVPLPPSAEPPRHRWQKDEPISIARSKVDFHPLNPRILDVHAKKKLRASLQRDGLVDTLCWNRTTGWIVGGNQRLALLDEEAGYKPDDPTTDYTLSVYPVEIDEARERELLVRLNNQANQGEFDFAGLERIARDLDVKVNLDAFGWDHMDLQVMFPDLAGAADLIPKKTPRPIPGDAGAAMDQAGEADTAPGEDQATRPAAGITTVGAEADSDILQMKAIKKKGLESASAENDTEFMLVFVGRDAAMVTKFLQAVGLDEDQRTHSLERLASAVGVELG